MNILLTGGAGYIGSHTALILVEAGHNIIILDNLCNSELDVIEKIEKIIGRKISFINDDIRDTNLLQTLFKKYQIEAVIHFAGLKAVGESFRIPLDYYHNNVLGSLSLFKAMDSCNVKKLIFSSSATVYGTPLYLPVDENHPKSPMSPYGRTKLQIEDILSDFINSKKDWKVISLRYFNPVGADNSGLLGEKPRGMPNNLMPYISQVAAKKINTLKVYGNDYATIDGTGVRDYIHVMDLAEGHLNALLYLDSMSGMEIFNLGAGRGYSVLEVISAYQKVSGKKIPYQIDSRRSGDASAIYASCERANSILNWRAKRSLLEMCHSSWIFESSLLKSD